MTECNSQLDFGSLLGLEVVADFGGGRLSSDGGVMLLLEADRRLGLTAALTGCVRDRRDQSMITHTMWTLLAQRIYQIACGYEDGDDADYLRYDWAFKTALQRRPESDPDLASQPTLSRLENSVGRTDLCRMADVFIEQFIRRYATAEKCRIIVDLDATDDETHGQQQFAAFLTPYDEHCYLPLIVTAHVDDRPQELLVAMLQPGNTHAGSHAVAVLDRLLPRLQQACPRARLLIRADGGFAKPALYNWCEKHRKSVDYEINLPQNKVLKQLAAPYLERVHARHEKTGQWQQVFGAVKYRAQGWPHQRRVVIKAEVAVDRHGKLKDNPRFVVTNLTATAAGRLYKHYCLRGDMENRIKELKNDLKSDRTSCHRFMANQLRVFLHAAAFVLHCELRRQLHGTPLERAQVKTLQVKLLKLGVQVRQTARRIWLHFAADCPTQHLWPLLLERLRAAPT